MSRLFSFVRLLALALAAAGLGAAATIHAYDLAVPVPIVRLADDLCTRLAARTDPAPASRSDPLPNKLFSERLDP